MSARSENLLEMEMTSALHLVIAAAVLVLPFLTRVEAAGMWSNVVVALIVAIVASYDGWAETHQKADQVADPSWILMLAGLWLVVYPFFVTGSLAYTWGTFAAGALLLVSAGFLVALSTMERRRQPRATP